MTRAKPELVVPDTSCLIALTGAGCIDALSSLYGRVAIPGSVAREFGSAPPPWIEVAPLSEAVQPLARALESTLGRGEAEVIALAAGRSGALVILDDRRARRVARVMRLRLTGTIGVLLRAKQAGVLPSVEAALMSAERVGFRVSSALRGEALRLAGESAPD